MHGLNFIKRICKGYEISVSSLFVKNGSSNRCDFPPCGKFKSSTKTISELLEVGCYCYCCSYFFVMINIFYNELYKLEKSRRKYPPVHNLKSIIKH